VLLNSPIAHLKVKYCFKSKLHQLAQPLHNIDIANDVINTHNYSKVRNAPVETIL